MLQIYVPTVCVSSGSPPFKDMVETTLADDLHNPWKAEKNYCSVENQPFLNCLQW